MTSDIGRASFQYVKDARNPLNGAKMRLIDARYLQDHEACPEQVKLFQDTFGDKAVPLTEATFAQAKEACLDVFWLKGTLSKPALAEYLKVYWPARAEYDKVEGLAWAEYLEVDRLALAEYDKVKGLARAEYEKVSELAVIRIWNSDTA